MKIRGARELRRSKEGSMPFAFLAVALLLITSTFCIVYANIDRTKENAEGITEELRSMDDVIEETRDIITDGLGTIIYRISADGSMGTMKDRVGSFDSMKDTWFCSQFPQSIGGIAVEIVEENINVDIQSTKVSSNETLGERSVASYLRAIGSVKATFTGTAGTATKTLQINADGTSGLPFIVDCATRFELSTEGNASLLSQLISYQLSALAQSRIVNGYGLSSSSGGNGTKDIITRADVEEAFKNGLMAVETLCFRSNAENDITLVKEAQIDLAEKIVLKNGYYEIDIGAILSQALLSIIDNLVMKWMEYLCIDKIVEIVDRLLDVAKEVINNIISFFKGNDEDNRNSARIYIKDAMASCGYSEDQYRYVFGSGRNVHVNGGTIAYTYEGKTGEYTFPDFDMMSESFNTDVLDWSGWQNYVVNYERNRNAVSDYIRGTLQSICSGMVSNYGVVRVSADIHDDTEFLESFTSAVYACLEGCFERISYDMESSLRNDRITDMLLESIYDTMVENRGSIFKEATITEDIREEITMAIFKDAMFNGHMAADEIYWKAYEIAGSNGSVNEIMDEYSANVDRLYGIYREVLTNPKNCGNSVLKELVITSGKEVLRQDFVKKAVTETAYGMMGEIKEHMRMNSGYGGLKLEGNDRYTLSDGYGGIYEEYTDIAHSYDLNIEIVDPTKNTKNEHSVNVINGKLASYLSVFSVRITGSLDYTAHSMTGVDRSLGRFDSEFRDTLKIDMCFDIPCVSAWSLKGADYRASTNIFNDAWNILLKALEPILEPLKKIYEALKAVFSICSETIMEINSYATKLIDMLYSAIMEPLEMLTEMVTDWISSNLCDAIEGLCGIVEGFDIGASNQKITFGFFGLHLTVELRLATMLKTTKNIVKLTLSGEIDGVKFSAFIDIKKNEKNGVMIRGGGGIENNDLSLDLVIDPEMKFGSKLVTLNGTIRDVDLDICMPYKVMYDEFEMALSDIPGVAETISNIPLPIPGFKCGFDMGVELKYNLPLGTGLMINEFESNPKGSDDGAEWVELYNATASTIDLSGYMLVPESNESKAFVITGTSIAPFEKKVILFERQSLNNSKSGSHSGESISLYSPDGKKVDSTPWKKDTYNDERTWQRKADGSNSWVFIKGTPGTSNGSIIKTNALVKEFLIDCLLKAADRAFEEMGNHLKSVDDIVEFLHRTLELFIKNVIDTIAEIVVSASVYISLEIADYTQSSHVGMKVAFEMNSDLVREGVYWLLKQLNILQDVVREPCCNDIGSLVCENTYLTTTVYTSISTPKMLSSLECAEIEVGFKAGVNMTGIADMMWGEDGKWKAFLGIVAEDIDASKLPKGLRSDKDKKCDLWLIRAELCKSDAPKSG